MRRAAVLRLQPFVKAPHEAVRNRNSTFHRLCVPVPASDSRGTELPIPCPARKAG